MKCSGDMGNDTPVAIFHSIIVVQIHGRHGKTIPLCNLSRVAFWPLLTFYSIPGDSRRTSNEFLQGVLHAVAEWHPDRVRILNACWHPISLNFLIGLKPWQPCCSSCSSEAMARSKRGKAASDCEEPLRIYGENRKIKGEEGFETYVFLYEFVLQN